MAKMKFCIILGEKKNLYSAMKAKEGNERWIFTSQSQSYYTPARYG